MLKIYGDETNALRPQVSFIPTVVLDHSQGIQSNILKNLLKEVCSAYTVRKFSCYIHMYIVYIK